MHALNELGLTPIHHEQQSGFNDISKIDMGTPPENNPERSPYKASSKLKDAGFRILSNFEILSRDQSIEDEMSHLSNPLS